MGNFNLNLACFVVRSAASDVPLGGEIAFFKCLPCFVLFCIIIFAMLKFMPATVKYCY